MLTSEESKRERLHALRQLVSRFSVLLEWIKDPNTMLNGEPPAQGLIDYYEGRYTSAIEIGKAYSHEDKEPTYGQVTFLYRECMKETDKLKNRADKAAATEGKAGTLDSLLADWLTYCDQFEDWLEDIKYSESPSLGF